MPEYPENGPEEIPMRCSQCGADVYESDGHGCPADDETPGASVCLGKSAIAVGPHPFDGDPEWEKLKEEWRTICTFCRGRLDNGMKLWGTSCHLKCRVRERVSRGIINRAQAKVELGTADMLDRFLANGP